MRNTDTYPITYDEMFQALDDAIEEFERIDKHEERLGDIRPLALERVKELLKDMLSK